AAEVPSDLERDWVDVLLAPDIADDAAGAGLPGDPLHVKGRACDEGDASATRRKIFDQRQSEARRASGDGDAQPFEIDGVPHQSHAPLLPSLRRVGRYKFKLT